MTKEYINCNEIGNPTENGVYEVIINDPDGCLYEDERYYSLDVIKVEHGYSADHLIPIHWEGTSYLEEVYSWKPKL